MRLLVNADDFGISKAVTLGILEAHENGVVSSTTLMCNMKDAEYAANLSKSFPKLGIGIHFVLTAGYPLSDDVKSLVDENGKFKKLGIQEESATVDDVRKEFRCQMNKFLSFGIIPTHIDTHHHMHGVDNVFKVVKEFASEYNLPVRLLDSQISNYGDLKATTGFAEGFYGEKNVNPENFIEILENNMNKESFEIMCHPGYLDTQILGASSYAIPRTKELETLTSEKLKEYIKKNNIELINYNSIK